MPDNFTANPGSGGAVFASDDIAGVQWPRVKIAWGVDGVAVDASGTDPLPVSVLNFPATQAVTQSGTWNVGVTGSVAVTGPLTDAQLRATAVPVSVTSLPALAAGTNNIGDVDVLTLPALPTGSNTIGAVNVNKTALTGSAPASVTIGGTSALVLASNANRRGAVIRNTSTSGQRISLAFAGGTAVLDSGVTLETGDVFVMDEFTFTTGAINAIASAASGRLSVQELTV
jgi:hypothetical protein